MGFARAVADIIAFVADGKIIEQAEPAQLFDNAKDPAVQRFLSRVLAFR